VIFAGIFGIQAGDVFPQKKYFNGQVVGLTM